MPVAMSPRTAANGQYDPGCGDLVRDPFALGLAPQLTPVSDPSPALSWCAAAAAAADADYRRRCRQDHSCSDETAIAFPVVEVGADPPVTYLYNSDKKIMK